MAALRARAVPHLSHGRRRCRVLGGPAAAVRAGGVPAVRRSGVAGGAQARRRRLPRAVPAVLQLCSAGAGAGGGGAARGGAAAGAGGAGAPKAGAAEGVGGGAGASGGARCNGGGVSCCGVQEGARRAGRGRGCSKAGVRGCGGGWRRSAGGGPGECRRGRRWRRGGLRGVRGRVSRRARGGPRGLPPGVPDADRRAPTRGAPLRPRMQGLRAARRRITRHQREQVLHVPAADGVSRIHGGVPPQRPFGAGATAGARRPAGLQRRRIVADGGTSGGPTPR